ncbi:MAG: hypothetical protein M2R45_03825 [Verrucomicrobia subdivision 3 bacterium]|nr:hypothetical protein [Limisphaerales bacterium]MCS1415781.1 hypothetical protein [Limisphaerales bacterium]
MQRIDALRLDRRFLLYCIFWHVAMNASNASRFASTIEITDFAMLNLLLMISMIRRFSLIQYFLVCTSRSIGMNSHIVRYLLNS